MGALAVGAPHPTKEASVPHYPQDELALEHRAAAVAILRRLTRPQREAVLLAALGLTHEEVAEVLNVCTSAVTQRMGRARRRLDADGYVLTQGV